MLRRIRPPRRAAALSGAAALGVSGALVLGIGLTGQERVEPVADAAATATATSTPRPTATPTTRPTATATAPAAPTVTPTPARGTIRVLPTAREGRRADRRAPLARGAAVELILDTSGSMLQPLGDELRIDVAKRVLADLVAETLPPGTPLALRVFGDVPESCETRLAVSLRPLDPDEVADEIAAIQAINFVRTPIGAALEQVADDLAEAGGPKLVILVTDGEETCGGDPAAAIQALADAGIDVRVNIVGFALDEALKDQFRAWARIGGGQYFDAGSAGELAEAVEQALQPPYAVLDADGNAVARGVVGGEPLPVPPGTYTVEVGTDPPRTIADVVVGPGEGVEITVEEE